MPQFDDLVKQCIAIEKLFDKATPEAAKRVYATVRPVLRGGLPNPDLVGNFENDLVQLNKSKGILYAAAAEFEKLYTKDRGAELAFARDAVKNLANWVDTRIKEIVQLRQKVKEGRDNVVKAERTFLDKETPENWGVVLNVSKPWAQLCKGGLSEKSPANAPLFQMLKELEPMSHKVLEAAQAIHNAHKLTEEVHKQTQGSIALLSNLHF